MANIRVTDARYDSETKVGSGEPAMLTALMDNDGQFVRYYSDGANVKVPRSFEGTKSKSAYSCSCGAGRKDTRTWGMRKS